MCNVGDNLDPGIFSSSPSDEPLELESERNLHNRFKAAAVSITQMYRESQRLKNQCLIEGYEQCLRDVWTYTAATAQRKSEHLGLAGSYQGRLTVEVTDLLSTLSKRLSSLQNSRLGNSTDKDIHSGNQQRRENINSQRSLAMDTAADPARSMNNTMYNSSIDSRLGHPRLPTEDSPFTNKRKNYGMHDPNLDLNHQFRLQKQYAFPNLKNNNLFFDSLQRKVKNEKLSDI